MITIVDYGLGNVLAFANVYRRLNIEVVVARDAEQLLKASKIILPGVGAFDRAMERLEESGMRAALDERVLKSEVPVLGVCVGMQMLGRSSDEGSLPGLNWVPGRVRAFHALPEFELPLPHMGWNDVQVLKKPLFKSLEASPRFYFLHSYFFELDDATDAAAVSSYGVEFACVVQHRHICGVQFHPEKSHHWGTQLLRNFAES